MSQQRMALSTPGKSSKKQNICLLNIYYRINIYNLIPILKN